VGAASIDGRAAVLEIISATMDKLAPAAARAQPGPLPGGPSPSGLRRILLIRHAECEMNLALDK